MRLKRSHLRALGLHANQESLPPTCPSLRPCTPFPLPSSPSICLEDHSLRFLARVLLLCAQRTTQGSRPMSRALCFFHLAESPRGLCPVPFPTRTVTSTLKPKGIVRAGHSDEESAFDLSDCGNQAIPFSSPLPRTLMSLSNAGLCHRSAFRTHVGYLPNLSCLLPS